ncbi:MAG: sulfotransferase domain-containing protein [Myxococcota bacterium]
MQGLKGKARARAAPRRSVHDFVPAPLRPSTILLGREVRDIAYRAMNVFSKVNARPLFVLGNQKSGTTAIAALLAEATGRSVTLDLAREVWNPTFHKIPSGELAFDDFVARNRWGFSREIVKEPNLTLFYPELVRTFPEATFLFVLRDPRDNIRSLLNRLNLPGDLDTLPEAAWSTHNPLSTPGWGVVFDARWRGIPGEHYIDRLAHRWRFCVEVYQANAARMQLCRYEDFIADKAGKIVAIAETLEYPIVGDLEGRLDYPFQPGGDPSSVWAEFFGLENQARIEAICAEGMAEMNYPREALDR